MYYSHKDMENLPFQLYQKMALFQARPLSTHDYLLREGVVRTREGIVEFEPGDYLAQGTQGEEWPITKEHFLKDYERVSLPDDEGFATYRAKSICQAYQIFEPFSVRRSRGDLLMGKAGDYLVRSGTRAWIADRSFFENNYEQITELD